MAPLLPKSHVLNLTIGFLLGILIFKAVTNIGKSLTVSWHTIEEYPDVELFGTHSPNELYHKGEDVVAQKIAQRVRILCWVLTGPKSRKKAKHVKATWGQRCNILLFMSSETDVSLPTVKLSVRDEYDYLWGKTKQALKYVYDHHLYDADWFFKADDDTYTIVENLRYMLSGFNTSDPLNFGLRFEDDLKNDYMNGGAGYVLSREALKSFVEGALYDKSKCLQDDFGPEDLELGKCLQSMGVNSVNTQDSYGRGRFFYFAPENYIIPNYLPKDLWYWRFLYYPIKLGMSCCSDTAITFHKVSPSQMHVLEYLIYHLRPYGISYHHNVPQGPDMYTESSSTEGSASTSLNAAPGDEKFSHPPQIKAAQLS